MKSVLTAIALAAVGALGACAPAARTSTHYLSIRNDTQQEVYVTYSGGVHSVSATIAPNSRVIMKGKSFLASVYASRSGSDFPGAHVFAGEGFLNTFEAVDARVLPSGDQVRVFDDDGKLSAALVGAPSSPEATR